MRRLLAITCLCALTAVGLVGCGSDGDDSANSSEGGSSEPTTTVASSGESSGNAAVDQFCDQVTAELDKINADSSAAETAEDGLKAIADLLGQSVELAKDTVGDPDAMEQLNTCTKKLQDISDAAS